jgi:VWFA-related protein
MVRKFGALAGVFFLSGSLSLGLLPGASRPDFSSQEKPSRPSSLQYEVSVILKLIHVYVTDKSGKPVVDLTRDDFVLTDNGKPVILTEFERHILESASGGTPAPAAPAVAPAPSETAKASAPGLMNRKFFLFFDFAYNNLRGILKAKKAALHFLDNNVRADDEVALLTYSALKGLTVEEYLTSDRDKVRKVLDRIDRKANAGQATEVEDKYWRLIEVGGGDDPNALRGEREDSKRMAETFLLKLTALAKALRLIPGQKQFILFSTGLPNSLVYGYVIKNSAFRQPPSDAAGDRVLRARNEEMDREFAASGCTFYAFDTRESAVPAPLFAYDEATMGGGRSAMFGPGGVSHAGSNVFRDSGTTGQNVLERLSNITGGKYYSNINLYEKNLDEVQSITGSFYVLGYSIGQEYDGRFHEVRVRVKRPGCVVRAQTGYFAPKPYAEYSEIEKRLHLFDLALNERSPFRLPVEFSMTALRFPLGGKTRSELLAVIPAEIASRFTGNRVEFYAMAFNAKGDISEVRRCEADPRPHHGQALLYSVGLALEPGDYDCRLVIRDMQTGMSAVTSTRMAVGAAAPADLKLCSPLILVEEAGTPVVDAGPATKTDPISWKDVYGFDRLSYSAATGAISKSHKRVVVLVPYSAAAAGLANIVFSASIVSRGTGERMPVSVDLAGTTGNADMTVARFEFATEALKPGRYLLYVYAQDCASRTLAHTQTSFTIVADRN